MAAERELGLRTSLRFAVSHVYGYGLYTAQKDGGWYTWDSAAAWSWWAPTDSYIQAVAWSGIRHEPAYDYTGFTDAYLGIYRDTAPNGWLAKYTWGHAAHWNYSQSTTELDATRVNIGIRSLHTGNFWNGGMVGLEGAYIVVNDKHIPENVLLKDIRPPLGPDTTGDGRGETPWMNLNVAPPQLEASATDRGLGLTEISLVDDQQRWTLWTGWTSNCNGSKSLPCPPYALAPLSHATAAYQLPEGITTVNLRAKDINDKYGYGTPFKIKNDRSAPEVSFSGSFYDKRALWQQAGSTSVTVTATDVGPGSGASAARSGVKRIDLFLDGVQIESTGDIGCAAGSCSMTRSLPIDYADYKWGTGAHQVKAVATDQLGHTTSQTFSVNVEFQRTPSLSSDDGNVGSYGTEASTTCGTSCATLQPGNRSFALALEDPPLTQNPSAPTPAAQRDPSRPEHYGLAHYNGDFYATSADKALFRALKLRDVRTIVPWNLMNRFGDTTYKAWNDWQDFLRSVNRYNADFPGEPLDVTVSFATAGAPDHLKKPTAAEYRAAIDTFLDKYGPSSPTRTNDSPTESLLGVRVKWFTAWNEPNNDDQVVNSDPVLAADYFHQIWEACKIKGCTVAAGEFVDNGKAYYQTKFDKAKVYAEGLKDPKWKEWLTTTEGQAFQAQHGDDEYIGWYKLRLMALGVEPVFWAWHAYKAGKSDSRYLSTPVQRTGLGWRRFERFREAIGKDSRIWLTEQNGVAVIDPPDEDPVTRTPTEQYSDLFNILAIPFDVGTSAGTPIVTKLFVYQWRTNSERWDSGLLESWGPASYTNLLDDAPRDTYSLFKTVSAGT